MNLIDLQKRLEARFSDNPARVARTAHFMGLIKTGLDGMASMGVVMWVEGQDLESLTEAPVPPDPLSSLDTAIELMQKASKNAGD